MGLEMFRRIRMPIVSRSVEAVDVITSYITPTGHGALGSGRVLGGTRLLSWGGSCQTEDRTCLAPIWGDELHGTQLALVSVDQLEPVQM